MRSTGARARTRTTPGRSGGASLDAAVAAAARDVLVTLLGQLPAPFPQACIDAGVASVEADYATALARHPRRPAQDAGASIWDGPPPRPSSACAPRTVPTRRCSTRRTRRARSPGEWRFTPDRPFAFAPGWGAVTPFVLRDSSQFRPGPPYAVTSRKYAADLNEVKALGGDGITTPSARTPEQTEIAVFWVGSSPYQWNAIARTVAGQSRQMDLWDNARLFGLLNLALADGYIARFETKYDELFWRPVTAIQIGDTDGNPEPDR